MGKTAKATNIVFKDKVADYYTVGDIYALSSPIRAKRRNITHAVIISLDNVAAIYGVDADGYAVRDGEGRFIPLVEGRLSNKLTGRQGFIKLGYKMN